MSTSLPHPASRLTALASLTEEPLVRIRAAQVVDGAGVDFTPGAILIEVPSGRVRGVGHPSDPSLACPVELDLGDAALIPGLVNGHAHLDLSLMGATEPGLGFLDSIAAFRRGRPVDPPDVTRAVTRGARRSLEGGVVAVGDIAGAQTANLGLAAGLALAGTPLWGMTLYEFFGIGADDTEARRRLAPVQGLLGIDPAGGAGLSPHAPYTVSLDAFAAAREMVLRARVPLVTHLAESPEEAALIGSGRGPLRGFLESLGLWNPRVASMFGQGLTPVAHLAPMLGPCVTCVHVNQASDDDLELLATSGASVVYCPRASAHYGGERAFGHHRYREMMARGIPVALGTDSVANLPAGAMESEGEGISVLEELRLLHRRDGMNARTLLRMATVVGARVIGLDASRVGFSVGCRPLGLVAISVVSGVGTPLERAMQVESRPLVLLGEKFSRGTRIV